MKIRTYNESDFKDVCGIYALSKLDELIHEDNDFQLIPLEKDRKRYPDFVASTIHVVEQHGGMIGFLGYGVCQDTCRLL